LERLPPAPTPYKVIDGRIVENPEVVAARDAAISRIRRELKRRLSLTSRKEVFIYIHGYHSTFEDAAFVMAELWHFFGREGLPIIYTWPAGYPGLFGYTYDRESSEFTVYHLKQVIAWLSNLPEIEAIHLIAHSRGTDVALSAFRELVIAARAAGISAKHRYKIKNLILAAPDFDVQVMNQRIMTERLGLEIEQLTLYTSPSDKAIDLAESLFSSPRGRLGTYEISDMSETEFAAIEPLAGQVTIVNFKGERSGLGHSYFRTNPEVSSDLVLLIRYGLKPGELGRPLQHVGNVFWRIPPGYPAVSEQSN